MKLIYKIARTELRNLFYSPVAWFLFIAFLVQCAYFYSRVMEMLAIWQEQQVQNNPSFTGFDLPLTQFLFLSPDGIYSNAFGNLFLFLPLLTMGLISREMNNGTIKLLYSSPVKTRYIVYGKFLAMMIYNLALIGLLGIFMIAGLLNIVHVDTGLVLSATVGFYLLICAFGAIGIFMSSLSTYQIVSAIATFILIFVLNRIGGLWQEYDFVRDLTYNLAMGSRTTNMIKGLISTKDVIYFLLITGMFISFTIFRIKGSRESIPWYKKVVRYLVSLAVVLAIGYISSRPGLIGYWDTTRNNLNTIHENTQEVIAAFEKGEPLEVTLYSNMMGGGAGQSSPAARNMYLWGLWEKYLRFKPDIKFNYVYYYDRMDGDSSLFRTYPNKTLKEIAQILGKMANTNVSRYMPPEAIRKMIDLQPENLRAVMLLKYKGKSTFLRTYNDSEFWPDEMNISAAFKRLQLPSMPQVLYTTGNLERSIFKMGEREFDFHSNEKGNRRALINIGFDVDTINPEQREIPEGSTTLVVADPKTQISPVKEERIIRYLQNGGNAYFLGEPGKQQMLNPILSHIGVELEKGTLVRISKHEMPHMIFPKKTKEIYDLTNELHPTVKEKVLKMHDRDTFGVIHPGSASVRLMADSGFSFKPIFITLPGSFNRVGAMVVDSVPPLFEPSLGDIKRDSFAVVAALSRKIKNKEQRILVSGDADFMSNVRFGGTQTGTGYFSWMADNRFPVYSPKPEHIDKKVTISAATGKTQSIFFIWILPALFFILGAVTLIRRKRK